MASVRLGGTGALVGAQLDDLVLDTISVVGKTAIWVLEGSAHPKTFIPQMIELWQAGRFPFDRLIEEFPLAEIDAAEEASLSGRVIKPVLRP
jgi:aryl-alcohol dehydrogenase